MQQTHGSIDALIARAREESPPPIDVTHRVLEPLRARALSASAPLLVFSAGSLAAALTALAYGFFLIQTITDPVTALFGAAAPF